LAYVSIGTFLHRLVFPVTPMPLALLPRAGDAVHNPLTGETLVLLKAHAETDGRSFEGDLILDPHSAVAFEHVHHDVEQSYTVVEGILSVSLAGEEREVRPGETLVVPPGTAYRPMNRGDQRVRFVAGGRPA